MRQAAWHRAAALQARRGDCPEVPLAALRPGGQQAAVQLPAVLPMARAAPVLPTVRESAACPDGLPAARLPLVAWRATAALRLVEPRSAPAVYGPEARQQAVAAGATARWRAAAPLDVPAKLQRAAVALRDVPEARPQVGAAQRGARAAPRQAAEARSDGPAAAELLDVPGR